MPKLEMFLLTPALTRMVESERPAFWLSVWEGRSWPAGYEAPPVTTGGRTVVGIRSPGGVDR
jgi:hypothetical protein